MSEDLWALERALWLEGPERMRAAMAADCVMVFPEPAGILAGPAILAGLAAAPRWAELAIAGARVARPRRGVAVLAYRAEARRADGPAYRALCASVWLEAEDGWRIAAHQQTPAG
jgi:Domain of unknown function (DUF4440)